MVDAITIRQDVFDAVRDLIIANKPSYTYNGTNYEFTVVAAYPDKDAAFPCIVLDKSLITMPIITMDGLTGDYEIEVSMEIFAKEMHGIKVIDVAQDSLQNTFMSNMSTLISTNKLCPQEDFWKDSGVSTFQDRNQLLNTSTITMRFKLG